MKKIAPLKVISYFESRLQVLRYWSSPSYICPDVKFLSEPPSPNSPVGLKALMKDNKRLVLVDEIGKYPLISYRQTSSKISMSIQQKNRPKPKKKVNPTTTTPQVQTTRLFATFFFVLFCYFFCPITLLMPELAHELHWVWYIVGVS